MAIGNKAMPGVWQLRTNGEIFGTETNGHKKNPKTTLQPIDKLANTKSHVNDVNCGRIVGSQNSQTVFTARWRRN